MSMSVNTIFLILAFVSPFVFLGLDLFVKYKKLDELEAISVKTKRFSEINVFGEGINWSIKRCV